MMVESEGGDADKKVLPKGKGLKKWRRIQRRRDPASAAATLPSPSPSPSPSVIVDEDVHHFLKRDSRRLAPALRRSGSTSPSPSAAAGWDSDNNTNTSSRSSTAASSAAAPPLRLFRNNNKSSSSIEPTKKAKAASASRNYKKSSIESITSAGDNFIFTMNGHLSFGASHSQATTDQRFKPTAQHLLADSIVSLQSLHQALQHEILKFEEIGKESILLSEDSTCDFPLNPQFDCAASKVCETNSCGQVPYEETDQSCSLPLDQAHIFERKLEEAMTMLKAKETRVAELEGILAKRESGGSVQWVEEKCRAMEAELEDLFEQKIEAEVECLTLRKASEELKAVSENQMALFEAQNAVIAKQNKIEHKLGDAERNNRRLDLSIETAEIAKMNSRMRKYGFCFLAQLMLWFLGFRLLFSQLWPSSTTFVPT